MNICFACCSEIRSLFSSHFLPALQMGSAAAAARRSSKWQSSFEDRRLLDSEF